MKAMFWRYRTFFLTISLLSFCGCDADMEINERAESRSAGTAVALGKSHIAILSGARGDTLREAYGRMGVGWEDFPRHPGFQRRPLFYDVKKDTWIGGSNAPLVADSMGLKDHVVAASAVTTKAVFWGGHNRLSDRRIATESSHTCYLVASHRGPERMSIGAR
jgi:hypothetical protein